eukprot:c7843_g1_i1.p1 GENE.c7843_g1_i1~~c7843_g1_i1.p1  ORF type:complete len:479 (-),score=86.86 c7843_g1_i1:17-1453(-)
MCMLFLPKSRQGLIPLALPCTSDQADILNPSPTTVKSWISNECGNTAMDYMLRFGFTEAFDTVDTMLASSVTIRSACRVVDRGPMELQEDRHRDWVPELWGCPNELIKKDDSDLNDFTDNDPSNVGCVPPCHGFLRHKSHEQIIEGALKYENSFSAIAVFFVIIKWVYSRQRFGFPSAIPLYIMVSLLCLHVILGMGVFKPYYEGVWCENDYTPAGFDYTRCSVQGAIVVFFGLSASVWWFWLVFCMHQTVVFEKKSDDIKKYVWVAQLTSWGIPSIALIISTATQNILYERAYFVCFISAKGNGIWQYLLFFMVTFAVLAVGMLLSFHVFLHLRNKYKLRATSGYSVVAALEVKTVCLIVIVFVIQVMLIVLRVESSVNEVKYSLVTAYIECLFSTYILGSDSPCKKIHYDDTVPIVVSVVLSIQGFLAGVVLLSDFKNFGKIKRSGSVHPTGDQSRRTMSSRSLSRPIAFFSKPPG